MSRIEHPSDFPVFYQDGDVLLPTSLCMGPWYPGTQHGSTMMLMAAWAAEQYPSEVPRQVTRLTVDMMKAAPVAPIECVTTLRKGGRYMEVLDISLRADGDECVRASALRFRIDEVPVPALVKFQGESPRLPPPLDFDIFAHATNRDGFHQAIDVRVDVKAQPAIMWLRLKQPVLPTLFATPLLRVALAADWTYSIPNVANHVMTREGFGNKSFYGINPDTTINLHRPPAGEWIGIQTHCTFDDLGAGTVMGQIFDEQGPVGFCSQSVLIRGSDAGPMSTKSRRG